jgi:hypothetical protein
MREISRLLRGSRGEPKISNISGMGDAQPEPALVQLVLDVHCVHWTGISAMERSATELLAWVLERHLESLAAGAAQSASHAATFVRGRWADACKVDGGLLDELNVAAEHGTEFDLIGKVWPKDTALARRLVRTRLDS